MEPTGGVRPPDADDPDVTSFVAGLAAVDDVRAVVITGSHSHGSASLDSDVDLFVYVQDDIAGVRRDLAAELADASHPILVNEATFGSGDVWRTRSGTWVDAIYWTPRWAEEQLDRVLVQHTASLGYSTAFWRSIATARPLYERDGWHPALQEWAASPYPDELVAAIFALNYPWVTDHPFSFLRQVEKAVRRGDSLSVNHRVSAWMASYFDLLFAANRVLHPGEKRQLEFAEKECERIPERLRVTIDEALHAADPTGALDRLIEQAGRAWRHLTAVGFRQGR